MTSVFISYSRTDSEFMERLRARLLENRIRVVYDNKFTAGNVLRNEIRQAIDQADAILVLESRTSRESPWVAIEIDYAKSQRKRIIPVVVPGENAEEVIHYDLAGLLYIPLQDNLPDKNIKAILKAIKTKNIPIPPSSASAAPLPIGSPPNPAPLWLMLLVREHLDLMVSQMSENNAGVWRGSLLWFYENIWYIAAENGRYTDSELRLWLKKGEGFAGQVWEENFPHSVKVDHPSETDLDALQKTYRLTPDQAVQTQRLGTIISYPMFDDNEDALGMVGIVSLDSAQVVDGETLMDDLDETRFFVDSLEGIFGITPDYAPMPYQSFRALKNILRVVRLIPPLDMTVRAGIYWIDATRDQLYLIVAAEKHETTYSKQSVALDKADPRLQYEPIILSWISGEIIPRQQQGEMVSISLPIRASQSPNAIIAILEVQCEDPRYIASPNQLQHFAHLADLCGKVLDNRYRPLNDAM